MWQQASGRYLDWLLGLTVASGSFLLPCLRLTYIRSDAVGLHSSTAEPQSDGLGWVNMVSCFFTRGAAPPFKARIAYFVV